MPRSVTSFGNDTVKLIRSLRDRKARRECGLFLAEGLRILAEARDSGLLPQIIAFTPAGAAHPLAAEIIAATEAAGGEAIETTPDILAKMSGKDNPGLVLGAYRQPSTDLAQIDRAAAPLWIVAQALRDPGNIGTILRTGDATRAGGLILIDDCADPYSVEAVRASMGAVFTQGIATARWHEFVTWLRAGPGQLVGT
ncbi:TrmH family RNA methyltransferase, partial [Sphingomonas sp.]|uniref:TrmH family RNA methyltransferase n=1 Tax=Sphingomonas sp. TaxID=28214 RepID=UPI00286D1D4C